MAKYLSVDTEATGLEADTYLIQLALVPVDAGARRVYREHGVEWMVHCPSFEVLKPRLNPWVLEHNEGLIRKAHSEGIAIEKIRDTVQAYLESPPIASFFGGERPLLLGKSLSALDIPLLTRYFGKSFMDKYFHHHTLDVTCIARALVDVGALPPGCASTSKLIKHLNIREDALHTALSDAVDMGEAYLKLLDVLAPLAKGTK